MASCSHICESGRAPAISRWAVHAAARPTRAAARRSSSALPSPSACDSPAWGFRPPLPDALRVFVRRHRCPRGEAWLTSAVGAIRRRCPRVPARRGRFGEKVEDARVSGPLARVALAGHDSRWPLLGRARAHVLPGRRTGALCQGSGAGPQSKHLAGFPSPGPAPPPKEPRGRLLAGAVPSFRGNQAVVELAAKGKYRAAALPHPLRPGATAPGRPQARPAGSHSTPTHLVPENGCPGKPNAPGLRLLLIPPSQPTSSCGPLLTLFSER